MDRYRRDAGHTGFRSFEQGQVLLVIILLVVVVLTVGLSLAARNITNLRQSSEEDQSQRAFSAAEAGIQVALQGSTQDSTGTVQLNDTTYQTSITASVEQEFTVNGGELAQPNEPVDIWLSTYPTYADQWSGPLSIYWGDADVSEPCSAAALEVAVLSGGVVSPTLTQYAYDPCAAGRSTPNNFAAPQATGPYVAENRRYKYRAALTICQATPCILMRIIPLYTNTPMAVVSGQAGNPLPVQGKVVESTGTAGETQRKIIVFQSYPKLPLEMFPYALFMPADRP